MRLFVDASLLIYLNTLSDGERRISYEEFYIDLVRDNTLYTDVLVLDELIYVSKRKYGVPYEVTLEFIESIVLPYVIVLPLGADEYNHARRFMLDFGLKPSDALHLGVMASNGIQAIVTEDTDFDKVKEVKRIWLEST